MKNRILQSFALIIGMATTCLPAFAADAEAIGRVPTVTRQVRIFSTLENEWLAAVQRRDKAAIEKLMAPDFEMRVAAQPGRPIPRADWIAQSTSEPQFASHIEQMATHEYGNMVVVSFLWNVDATDNLPAVFASRLFVIDTWVQESGNWRIAVRYAAPLGAADARVPGAAHEITEIQKKY